MSLVLLAVLAAGPFPLPAIDGKPLAVTDKQTTFRLPMRFEKVRDFYAAQFTGDAAKDVTVKPATAAAGRVLTITSKRKGDEWSKATITEKETETVVEVARILRMAGEDITGNGKPLVEFVFGRSAEVDKAVNGIDHTESMRAR